MSNKKTVEITKSAPNVEDLDGASPKQRGFVREYLIAPNGTQGRGRVS
jgi:hypothetical protein